MPRGHGSPLPTHCSERHETRPGGGDDRRLQRSWRCHRGLFAARLWHSCTDWSISTEISLVCLWQALWSLVTRGSGPAWHRTSRDQQGEGAPVVSPNLPGAPAVGLRFRPGETHVSPRGEPASTDPDYRFFASLTGVAPVRAVPWSPPPSVVLPAAIARDASRPSLKAVVGVVRFTCTATICSKESHSKGDVSPPTSDSDLRHCVAPPTAGRRNSP